MVDPTLDRAAAAAAERVERCLGEDAQAAAALAEVCALDVLNRTVPADFGGYSGIGVDSARVSVRELCRVRQTLAWHSGMLDVMFVEQGLGSYPIALGGSPELARAVLADVMAGRKVSAFALTEEGAGSDLNAVSTVAQRRGDGWVLRGSKTFISNAGIASFYTVLARTAGQPGDRDGLTMFYVPAGQPGLTVERFEVMAPHPIGRLRFEDVPVESGWMLGEEGRGLDIALGTLAQFRTSVAAAATGFARRAMHESMAHLEARVQFGRPLSSFQGLRFDIAEMDVRLRASELLVEEAASAMDAGGDAGTQVARAKYFATETASWICDRAVQHLGGLGVKRGHIVERLYREVRALRIYEGTSEVQKLILAKAALERHRKSNG
ncbi:MAG: acyl-CoA dehydrogenase [Planctomycetota bacterium]